MMSSVGEEPGISIVEARTIIEADVPRFVEIRRTCAAV
jgi:hypothetical protein